LDRLGGHTRRPPNLAGTKEIGTARLEAFSDGVFAIAATLLVLEIDVHTSGAQLTDALTRIWPSYLAYVTSFITIGIIWINHHHNMRAIERLDRTFMFINLLLLLDVAFIPFPTKLVAEYLRHDGEGPAVIAYAGTLLLMAVLYTIWWRYARNGRRLIAPSVSEGELRAIDRGFVAPGLPLYTLVFALAFFTPFTAVVLTFALAAFYLPSATLFTGR
jgi:TMEM175 potassium channel family protein